MMIEVITIDFWNTLYDSSNGTKRNAIRQHVLHEEISKYNIIITPEQYDNALKSSWEFFNNIWLNEQRTPQTEETIDYFWKFLGLPEDKISTQKVANIFKDSILDYPPKLMNGVMNFLEKYHNQVKIGLISDTGFTPGSILLELMEKDGVKRYFDGFSFSDETGVSKPNPKAFFKILDEFDCKAINAIHIGDIEKTDILGAKKIGMQAIRFIGDIVSNPLDEDKDESIADYICKSWDEINFVLENELNK